MTVRDKEWMKRTASALGLEISQHDGKIAIGRTGDYHVDKSTWMGSWKDAHAFLSGVDYAVEVSAQAVRKSHPEATDIDGAKDARSWFSRILKLFV